MSQKMQDFDRLFSPKPIKSTHYRNIGIEDDPILSDSGKLGLININFCEYINDLMLQNMDSVCFTSLDSDCLDEYSRQIYREVSLSGSITENNEQQSVYIQTNSTLESVFMPTPGFLEPVRSIELQRTNDESSTSYEDHYRETRTYYLGTDNIVRRYIDPHYSLKKALVEDYSPNKVPTLVRLSFEGLFGPDREVVPYLMHGNDFSRKSIRNTLEIDNFNFQLEKEMGVNFQPVSLLEITRLINWLEDRKDSLFA